MKTHKQQSAVVDSTGAQPMNNSSPYFDASEAGILRLLSEAVIDHPVLMNAYEKACTLIARNEHCSEPRHLLVVGDAGCGKSTLCDMIDREFGSFDQEFSLGIQRSVGALITSVPSPVTPRSMASEMLRKLGVSRNLYQTTRELTEELLAMLGRTGVKVVVLDEFQHLFSIGESPELADSKRPGRNGCTNKQLLEVQDWIKSLIVKSGVTFVLVGQPSITALIRSEPQLARRFTHICRLRPFALPEGNAPSELGTFVKSLLLDVICDTKGLDDTEWSDGNEEEGQRMHLATGGVPSTIKDLVTEACLIAWRKKDSVIRLAHFAEAYEVINDNVNELNAIRKAQGDDNVASTVRNPFTAKIQQVQSELFRKAA